MKKSIVVISLAVAIFLSGCSEHIPSDINLKQTVKQYNNEAVKYQSPPKAPKRHSTVTFSGPTQQELEEYDKASRVQREMDQTIHNSTINRYGRRDIP